MWSFHFSCRAAYAGPDQEDQNRRVALTVGMLRTNLDCERYPTLFARKSGKGYGSALLSSYVKWKEYLCPHEETEFNS
jgi:hypothetical protein